MNLGPKSTAKLVGVHPDLIKVVKRAIQISKVDFQVIEGVRTPKRQAELYAQGRTKPGKKVTWTLNSRHIGGFAVDLAALVDGKIDWADMKLYIEIGRAMFVAAQECGVPIRWGADWDGDGKPHEKGEYDSVHFELSTKYA